MVGTETPNYLKPKGNSAVSPDWEIQEWMWLWEGSGRKRFWLAWLGSGAIPWANQCGQYQFSHSVVSNSLRFHGLQHARLPCPSPTPGACSNSCLLSQWCHPTISSSVVPFSCLQSFPISARTLAFLFMYLFNVDHNGKLKYMFLVVCLFFYLNSNDPAWPLLCCGKSILYLCISIPALQLGSSVPFFWIPHVCVNTQYLFFFFWLTWRRGWDELRE